MRMPARRSDTPPVTAGAGLAAAHAAPATDHPPAAAGDAMMLASLTPQTMAGWRSAPTTA